jgi:hypothetical protein
MSFIENDQFYVNPPSPYDGPDFDSRLPGWGPMARAAGPSRWGVGAVPIAKTMTTGIKQVSALRVAAPGGAPAPSASTGMPWWVWVAVPMVVGGAALFAYDMGWFGD